MATFVWASAIAGNWSVGANWQVGGVAQAAPPTAADDVLFGSGTGFTQSNCTITAASVCRSMVDTGYTGTKSGSGDLAVGDASGGAVTLASGATYSGTWTMTFASTSNNGGAGWNVTSNGKTFPGAIAFDGVGGKWTCADAPTWTSKLVTFTNGSLSATNLTFTWGTISSNNSNTRVIDFTGSTMTLNQGGASTCWNMPNVTNATISPPTNLIITTASTSFNCAGSATITFVNITATGTGSFSFNSSCTMSGTLTRSNAAAVTLRAATGFTITFAALVASGTSGNLVSINCTTGGSRCNFTKSSGAPANLDFVNIKDINYQGVIPLYAGTNSTDGGNNVNVVFYSNPGTPLPGSMDRAGMSNGVRQRSARKERLFNTKTPYYSVHKGR